MENVIYLFIFYIIILLLLTFKKDTKIWDAWNKKHRNIFRPVIMDCFHDKNVGCMHQCHELFSWPATKSSLHNDNNMQFAYLNDLVLARRLGKPPPWFQWGNDSLDQESLPFHWKWNRGQALLAQTTPQTSCWWATPSKICISLVYMLGENIWNRNHIMEKNSNSAQTTQTSRPTVHETPRKVWRHTKKNENFRPSNHHQKKMELLTLKHFSLIWPMQIQ